MAPIGATIYAYQIVYFHKAYRGSLFESLQGVREGNRQEQRLAPEQDRTDARMDFSESQQTRVAPRIDDGGSESRCIAPPSEKTMKAERATGLLGRRGQRPLRLER